MVNRIYSGEWGPSDPVPGVVELPNYDTKIRFTLGDNNERIYFYNDTTQNYSGWHGSLYSYVTTNFPSRMGKLNIFFTAGYNEGRVTQENIQITSGGSGYTSAPTVIFNPSGATATAIIKNGVLTGVNVTSGGAYNGFAPPQITISGGGGSGAKAIVTKLAGGATGSAVNKDYVVMWHCHEASDWICGMCLAHELGHCLDLNHTYCGGGFDFTHGSASAKICYAYCSIACDIFSCSTDEYLSDIFGTCPGTYPHIANWGDPYNNTIPNAEKITNNVMGGQIHNYIFLPCKLGKCIELLH